MVFHVWPCVSDGVFLTVKYWTFLALFRQKWHRVQFLWRYARCFDAKITEMVQKNERESHSVSTSGHLLTEKDDVISHVKQNLAWLGVKISRGFIQKYRHVWEYTNKFKNYSPIKKKMAKISTMRFYIKNGPNWLQFLFFFFLRFSLFLPHIQQAFC